jgi:hypothetical protein
MSPSTDSESKTTEDDLSSSPVSMIEEQKWWRKMKWKMAQRKSQ